MRLDDFHLRSQFHHITQDLQQPAVTERTPDYGSPYGPSLSTLPNAYVEENFAKPVKREEFGYA